MNLDRPDKLISLKSGEYLISNDKSLLNISVIHQYLRESYWAKDIPLEIVERSIENSFCIGVYLREVQIGFARIVTDYATYGYLADVFILEEHRGIGLSKKLMAYVMALDFVKLFRRFSLGTRDAHTLYSKYGFTALKAPERMMELHQPDVYVKINLEK